MTSPFPALNQSSPYPILPAFPSPTTFLNPNYPNHLSLPVPVPVPAPSTITKRGEVGFDDIHRGLGQLDGLVGKAQEILREIKDVRGDVFGSSGSRLEGGFEPFVWYPS